jgi:integrase
MLLGPYGSEESYREYERVLAEWRASNGRMADIAHNPCLSDMTINELLLAFVDFAETHYRHLDGTPTGELENIKDAVRPLRKLYGHTLANEFSAAGLEAIQSELIQGGLARTTINARINRIRRVFKWGIRKGFVTPSVLQSLQTLPGLQRGRCRASEAPGILPVDETIVEKALRYMPRLVAAMVKVQLLSGCRPGEVVLMRSCDLTQGKTTWEYRPCFHKNEWRGKERKIQLGPQAQAVIKEFLKPEAPEEFLFCPRETVMRLHAQRGWNRKTRRTPSDLRRGRKRNPRRGPGDRYTVNTYRQAIVRACRKANVPEWSPLQLRHTRATEIREKFRIEGAQAVLGHQRCDVTQIYAERNENLAAQIMAQVG